MLSRPDALVDLLSTGPENAAWRFLLAHGAGAPMDSAFMTAIADGLAVKGIGCDRFEFPYMARAGWMGRNGRRTRRIF